jgi:putative hydrolase of the HAD superfamily
LTSSINSALKGVLLDFGDTLAYIDRDGNTRYRRALHSILREHGFHGSLDGFSAAFDHAIRHSMKGELKTIRRFWGVLLDQLELHGTSTRLIDELENVRRASSGTVFQLYEGAHHVLKTLQQRYKLALVSNCAIGTSDEIETLGLARYFECIVLSYRVGVRKPDSRIYLEALQCLGLEPSACIFVADEISDLEGARALGLKTMLVRQGPYTYHEAEDPNFEPDCECDHIADITRFL